MNAATLEALASANRQVFAQALADAIAYRRPGGDCADCAPPAAGLCSDHAADEDRAADYAALGRELGIEVTS